MLYWFSSASNSNWSLKKARYANISYSIGLDNDACGGIFFSSDGTKAYVLGTQASSDNIVYELDLSSAWDVATCSYNSVSFALHPANTTAYSLNFSNDGLIMYVANTGASDLVFQYTLGVAWDLSTAAYTTAGTFSSQTTIPTSAFINSDGTKLFVSGGDTSTIFRYTLAVPYNVASKSYDTNSFVASAEVTSLNSFFFSTLGDRLFILDLSDDTVYQYNLGTPFDLSTASYSGLSFSVTTQENAPTAIAFKTDGGKMYVVGNGQGTIFQYTLS